MCGKLEVNNCFNKGIVNSTKSVDGGFTGAGGIIGYICLGSTVIINTLTFGEFEVPGTNVGGIIGRHQTYTESTKLRNSYFENTIVKKGIGAAMENLETENLPQGTLEVTIKSKAFVDELNKSIEDGCPYEQENTDGTTTTITIDTTGWAKWVYNENSYPTLDTTTTWDATIKEWVKK